MLQAEESFSAGRSRPGMQALAESMEIRLGRELRKQKQCFSRGVLVPEISDRMSYLRDI